MHGVKRAYLPDAGQGHFPGHGTHARRADPNRDRLVAAAYSRPLVQN